jgi:nitrogenase-stabilizing/protective protein
MDTFTERLQALSSAEDFLRHFGVPFDEHVLQVNRLHILKRFYQYLNQGDAAAGLDDAAQFGRYHDLLARAYQDFESSTPAREKVFKVFQTADGQQQVPLSTLRASLDERRREPRAT